MPPSRHQALSDDARVERYLFAPELRIVPVPLETFDALSELLFRGLPRVVPARVVFQRLDAGQIGDQRVAGRAAGDRPDHRRVTLRHRVAAVWRSSAPQLADRPALAPEVVRTGCCPRQRLDQERDRVLVVSGNGVRVHRLDRTADVAKAYRSQFCNISGPAEGPPGPRSRPTEALRAPGRSTRRSFRLE